MEELKNQRETRISKAIFPNTLNANDTLFGGLLMQWMDEAAYIAATRFTHQRMFTLKVNEVNFHKSVGKNSIIEVIAKVKSVGSVKLEVEVTMLSENMYDGHSYMAAEASFTMVSLNENNKPQRLNWNVLSEECLI